MSTSTIEGLLKNAMQMVMDGIERGKNPFPYSIFNLKADEVIYVDHGAEIAEGVLALGISNTNGCLRIPDGILCALVFFPRTDAFVECTMELDRYILLCEEDSRRQWWIEGNVKNNSYGFVDYFNIPESVQNAICAKLAGQVYLKLCDK